MFIKIKGNLISLDKVKCITLSENPETKQGMLRVYFDDNVIDFDNADLEFYFDFDTTEKMYNILSIFLEQKNMLFDIDKYLNEDNEQNNE